jgi:hypothetical protein
MRDEKEERMDERIAAAIERRAKNGELRCAEAFRIAEELGVAPLAVGQTANELDVRLARCQLGLFGHGPQKSITEAAEEIPPDLEQAIREGLILGRLPCAVAWAIAARFGMPKLHVANAAEGLEVRIAQCELGAF